MVAHRSSTALAEEQPVARPAAAALDISESRRAVDGPATTWSIAAPLSFTLFDPPRQKPAPIGLEPCLATWDRRSAPSQVRMRTYLAHLDSLHPPEGRAIAPLAIQLDVGLPEGVTLVDGGRDLDNYLYPVVQHLGQGSVSTAWATKSRGQSQITIDGARPSASTTPEGRGWAFQAITTQRSTDSAAWKREIADQLVPVALGDGAVTLHIAYRVSPQRNWANLWKPTVDSLGGLLGEGSRPFSPRDDRITTLAFHRTLDATIGWKVHLGIWIKAS